MAPRELRESVTKLLANYRTDELSVLADRIIAVHIEPLRHELIQVRADAWADRQKFDATLAAALEPREFVLYGERRLLHPGGKITTLGGLEIPYHKTEHPDE